MPRLSESNDDSRPAFMRIQEDALSWLSLLTSDIACQIAHYASMLLHMFVMAVAVYAFVSCGSDLGFDESHCSGNSSRVLISWAAGALALVTLAGGTILISTLRKSEQRDSEQASHENRLARLGLVGLCVLFTFIFMILDFVMMSNAFSLSQDKWLRLTALGYMEMVAGFMTFFSVILYALKFVRIFRRRNQVYEVLNNLETYADEEEEGEV